VKKAVEKLEHVHGLIEDSLDVLKNIYELPERNLEISNLEEAGNLAEEVIAELKKEAVSEKGD
jgi:hypothetical protein